MPLSDQMRRLIDGTTSQFALPEVTEPTLPAGFSVEEVRRILALVLADVRTFDAYLAAAFEAFGRLPVAVHDKWFSIDEPDTSDELILNQGPAGLDATGLARLAMSGPTLEHWEFVLLYSEMPMGNWFFEPLVEQAQQQ